MLAALNHAGASIAWCLRDYSLELASAEAAIAGFRTVGDSLGVARAQSLAGHALLCLYRFAEAKPVLQEALMIRSAGYRRVVPFILRCLGYVSGEERDFVAARSFYAEALQIYQTIGAELGIAKTVKDLAITECQAGNAELALSHATEALAIFRSCNDAPVIALTLFEVAEYLIELGRYDEAEISAREAFDLAHEQQLDKHAAWAMQALAVVKILKPQTGATAFAEAARVLAFVNARLDEGERLEFRRTYAIVCDTMGADSVAKFLAEGATMTEEQAVATVLSAE